MFTVASALFEHKSEIEVLGVKIGQNGIARIGVSEHRTAMGAPKISAIAKIFDLIKTGKHRFAIYQSNIDESIYCEFDDDGFVATKKTIKGTSFDEHSPYALIPQLWFELSCFGKNTELKEVFKRAASDLKTGDLKDTDVFQFCDSYYYGCAKEIVNIDNDTALNPEEVKAAFRAGTYEPHDMVKVLSDLGYDVSKSAYEGTARKKKKESKKKEDNFIQDCKEGKYVVPYEWPEKMRKYIIKPSFLDTFEVTPEFKEIVKKIVFRSKRILERMDMGLTGAEAIGKDALNVMLLGKPGTGKTTLAYALSAATGMPVCTTAWNKHSDEDEVEGKTKIVDGKPSFVETNALLFHEFGGIDVNEEINLADPSVTMGSLGQKLEYPFIVKKNGYETIVRHPLNVVIATMNVGTNGSNPLNQALANRFTTPYILDDPTRETFIGILQKASRKSREICEWVYKAYEQTTTYLRSPDVNEEEICQNLSIRTCLGAIEHMEEGQEPVRALINSIVGAVAVVDIEVARRLEREKISCLPNPPFDVEEVAA